MGKEGTCLLMEIWRFMNVELGTSLCSGTCGLCWLKPISASHPLTTVIFFRHGCITRSEQWYLRSHLLNYLVKRKFKKKKFNCGKWQRIYLFCTKCWDITCKVGFIVSVLLSSAVKPWGFTGRPLYRFWG